MRWSTTAATRSASTASPWAPGREQPLKPGDQLQIGGYVIAASAAAAAAGSDPFSDLFGEEPLGLAAPPQAQAAPRTAMAATAMWPRAFRIPRCRARRRARCRHRRHLHHVRRHLPLGPGHIPDDWDPFAPDTSHDAGPPPSSFASPASAPRDVFAGLPRAAATAWTTCSACPAPPAAATRWARRRCSSNRAMPNMAQHADPLESLQRTATLMPPSRSDHGSELNMPMSMPRAPSAPAAPPQQPQPAPLPSGAIFSWNDPPRDGRVVTLPGAMLSGMSSYAPAAPAYVPPAPAPRPQPAPPAYAAPASAGSGDTTELLSALLSGLDAPGCASRR